LNYLADACALIMFHGGGGKTMTPSGLDAMAEGNVFVSPITVWEITRKTALGKLPSPTPPGYPLGLTGWLHEAGYRMLPLTWHDGEGANALPDLHKDPMDRILIATAIRQNLTIITRDRIFADYGIATVW
jgi:PIN domain nuclease of toxin-antitoxin system